MGRLDEARYICVCVSRSLSLIVANPLLKTTHPYLILLFYLLLQLPLHKLIKFGRVKVQTKDVLGFY